MDIKEILENYILDIDLILEYNDQFGGADEMYYIQLQKNLENELNKLWKLESGHIHGGINDKSAKY